MNSTESKSNAPRYAPQDCEKCGIWGHKRSECGWIHKRFPSLLIDFANMKQLHTKHSNASVNVTTQDNNKNKNKDSNDSSNNKQESKSNSWYKLDS